MSQARDPSDNPSPSNAPAVPTASTTQETAAVSPAETSTSTPAKMPADKDNEPGLASALLSQALGKRGKLKVLLPLAIIVVLATFIASALFLPIFGFPLIELVQHKDDQVSDIMLEEIKDVYRFSTIEYFYKVVYPYDLLDPKVNLVQLSLKLKNAGDRKLEEVFSLAELEWLRVIDTSRRLGLKIGEPHFQFIVASVVLRAGFDLQALAPSAQSVLPVTADSGSGAGSDTAPSLGSGTGAGGNAAGANTTTSTVPLVQIEESQLDGEPWRIALVRVPPAVIMEARVEDPERESYAYPDVPLSPEGWKTVSALLLQHAQQRAIRDGILDKASENARDFLQRLLLNAGFNEVRFLD